MFSTAINVTRFTSWLRLPLNCKVEGGRFTYGRLVVTTAHDVSFPVFRCNDLFYFRRVPPDFLPRVNSVGICSRFVSLSRVMDVRLVNEAACVVSRCFLFSSVRELSLARCFLLSVGVPFLVKFTFWVVEDASEIFVVRIVVRAGICFSRYVTVKWKVVLICNGVLHSFGVLG